MNTGAAAAARGNAAMAEMPVDLAGRAGQAATMLAEIFTLDARLTASRD